jgi:hypothetical protein
MPTIIISGPANEKESTELATIDMCEESVASVGSLGINVKNVNAIYTPTTQKEGRECLVFNVTELFTVGYDDNPRTKKERVALFAAIERDCSAFINTNVFKRRPVSVLILPRMVDRAEAMCYEWSPPLYQYSKNQNECLIRMYKGKMCNKRVFYDKYITEASKDFPDLVDGKIKRSQYGYRGDNPIFGISFIPPAECEIPAKYVRVEKLSTPLHE